MSDWVEVVARDLEQAGIVQIEDGNHGEYRPRPEEFVAQGVSFIRAANLDAGVVDFEGAGKISATARERIRKGIGRPGDVLLSHKGTVGKVAWAPQNSPEFVCSPQTTLWRSLDEERLDRRYLRFFLESPAFVHQLETRQGQSDMAPYVSLTEQRGLVVTLPPPNEQRAMAEVLGALDDKLTANMVASKAADAWVRGRFRQIEAATATVAVSTVIEQSRNLIDPSTRSDCTNYVGLEHLPRRLMWLDGMGDSGSVVSSKWRFEKGDILFGKLRPYFHKVASAPAAGICSTDILVLRPKEQELAGFALAAVSSDRVIERCTSASEGTRMPRTRWKDLASFEVPWPGQGAALVFGAEVTRLRDAVEARMRENVTLTELRNTMLPALMSGRLRVKDAERVVEGVI